MTAQTTKRDLDRIVERIASELGGAFYVEGSASGWTLYEELSPGAHQVAFGRTKGELYAIAGGYLAGLERMREALGR
jgi:hypothetical protein